MYEKESAASTFLVFSYMDGLAGILHGLTQSSDADIGVTTRHAVPTSACIFAFYVGVLRSHAGISNWNDIYLATYTHRGYSKISLEFDGRSGTLSKMGIGNPSSIGLSISGDWVNLDLNTLDFGMGAIFYDKGKFSPTV